MNVLLRLSSVQENNLELVLTLQTLCLLNLTLVCQVQWPVHTWKGTSCGWLAPNTPRLSWARGMFHPPIPQASHCSVCLWDVVGGKKIHPALCFLEVLTRVPLSTFLRLDGDEFQICCHKHAGSQEPERPSDSKLDAAQGRDLHC